MKVSVDNQPVSIEEGSELLSKVVDQISSGLPADRIITEILADGAPIFQISTQNEQEKYSELLIRTSNRRVWATGGLEYCLTILCEIQRSIIRVAEGYREGKIHQSQVTLNRCLDGLDRFIGTLFITRQASEVDIDTIENAGDTTLSLEVELKSLLDRILLAQQKQDFNEVAEHIEIGLVTHIHAWQKLLSKVHEGIPSDD